MSLIKDLRSAEAEFEAAKARLEDLKKNPELKALKEFEKEIRDVLARHGKSLVDVNMLLDADYKVPKPKPGTAKDKPSVTSTGKAVSFRRYTNPHTGEKVDHYRGANTTITKWRKQYGEEVVNAWAERVNP